jgi:hypothetical protein
MNILMIAINDPAGTAISFAQAINRNTEHTCRLITKEIRYNFMYAKDLHLPWLSNEDWDEVEHLLKSSDIFHFHMTTDEHTALGPFIPNDYIKGKTIVHHHHGHPDFRGNPRKYRNKYQRLKRSKIFVSTPDLLHLIPTATWLPNLIPINTPHYMPNTVSLNNGIRIGQSVTRRDLKNTDDLIEVVGEINKSNPFKILNLDIIENTEHRQCLRRKNGCHLVFDHMQGYFGVSSLESLSQGKTVIAGLDTWNCKQIKEFTGADELPWILARNREELKIKIESLVSEPETTLKIGYKSRKFMENFWTEDHVLKILLGLYENN